MYFLNENSCGKSILIVKQFVHYILQNWNDLN